MTLSPEDKERIVGQVVIMLWECSLVGIFWGLVTIGVAALATLAWAALL